MLNFMSRASKEANERQEYVRALVRRAKGKEENKPASKASRMLRFSPSTIYFLILEKDWWFCGFLTSLVYGVPVVIVGLLSMLLELANGRFISILIFIPPPKKLCRWLTSFSF